jgi:hypothetical protein
MNFKQDKPIINLTGFFFAKKNAEHLGLRF